MDNLSKDPYNIIITGVGGQGNVTASRILGNILARTYVITTGETFGVSQRGGSVMSHIRVSADAVWSPQIPKGKADLVIALEPGEAVRVMKEYGNETSRILVNVRPVYPISVGAGALEYPPLDAIKETILELTDYAWFINATALALQIGDPILGNMIMLGAVSQLDLLPMDEKEVSQEILNHFPKDKVKINIKAFEIGAKAIL